MSTAATMGNGAATFALSQMRDQLQTLEKVREEWNTKRQMSQKRGEELDRQLQNHYPRKTSIILSSPLETAAMPDAAGRTGQRMDEEDDKEGEKQEEVARQAPPVDVDANKAIVAIAARAEQAKRQELRELTQQLVQKHKQIKTKFAYQLRSIQENDEQLNNTKRTATCSPPPIPAQLQSSPASNNATTPPKKRNKTLAVAASGTTAQVALHSYPPLVARDDMLLPCSSSSELASIAFRVATRHFLETGQKPSPSVLHERMNGYCGRPIPSDELAGILEDTSTALALCVQPRPAFSATPREAQAAHRCKDREVPSEPRVRAWIDAEKDMLDECVASWTASPQSSDARASRLVAAMNALAFQSHASVSDFLLACLDTTTTTDAAGRRSRHWVATTAYPHLDASFQAMKTVVVASTDTNCGEPRVSTTTTTGTTASETTAMAKFRRPFDVDRDSVMKQVRKGNQQLRDGSHAPHVRKRRRADPMRVMCMYELSGVCNDVNCPYQHQRDFDENENDDDREMDNVPCPTAEEDLLMPPTTKTVVNQFLQLRGELRGRWPSMEKIQQIILQHQSVKLPSTEDVPQSPNTNGHATASINGSVINAIEQDFLSLGSPMSPPPVSHTNRSARYCAQEHHHESHSDVSASARFSIGALETHVRAYPEDVDAWLLLAVRSLELEFSWSDDSAWLTESARLHGELAALQAMLCGASSWNIDASKLTSTLRVLSRALEAVEANAYCEELWLLHFQLSHHLAGPKSDDDLQEELKMAHTAVQFLPQSVALWRHFLTLRSSSFDALDDAVALYLALLQAIATEAHSAKDRVRDAFSVLLSDVVIQLCTLYCHANAPEQAVAFLESFLSSASIPAEREASTTIGDATANWQSHVRDRIIGDDLLTLYVLLVYVTLFQDVPFWLAQRAFASSEAVDVYRLLLSYDIEDAVVNDTDATAKALEFCQAAFHEFSADHDQDLELLVPPGMEVLRHNWVVIMAKSHHLDDVARLEHLKAFTSRELRRKCRLPRVLVALATFYREVFGKPEVAEGLIDELSANYSTSSSMASSSLSPQPPTREDQRFGEALHHFLLHRPTHFVTDPFQDDFPTLASVAMRLAAILPAESDARSRLCSKSAFNLMEVDADPKNQQKALVKVFSVLMRETLDLIAAACRIEDASGGGNGHGHGSGGGDSDEQDIAQDTYYLLAQAQVLAQVCNDPWVAVEALDRLVIEAGTTTWAVLPMACRRMVWAMRFVFHGEMLKKNKNKNEMHDGKCITSRDLLTLFQRYLADVGSASTTTVTVQFPEMEDDAAEDDGLGNERVRMPRMQLALGDFLRPLSSSATITSSGGSDAGLDMELFELCLAALPRHEWPRQFGALQHQLSVHPQFLVHYADTALQDSDWRRARSALRRMAMQDTLVIDPQAFRMLLSLEIKDKNVHGLTQLLSHRVKINPLDHTLWQSIGVLEILFGEASDSKRAEEFATAFAKTKGVQIELTRTLHGCGHCGRSIASATQNSSVHCSSLLLASVPSTLFMGGRYESLHVLDLSFNMLVSLPRAISRFLPQLRELKLTGNALASLPLSIGQLSSLRVLELAHNNLTAVPNAVWDGCVHLRQVDLRFNALNGLSPRILRLTELKSLRVQGNNLTWNDLQPIVAKMPSATLVDINPATTAQQEEVKATTSLLVQEQEAKIESDGEAERMVVETPQEQAPPDDDVVMVDEEASETVSGGAAAAAGAGDGETLPASQPTNSKPMEPTTTTETPSDTDKTPSPPPLMLAEEISDDGTESEDDDVEFLGCSSTPAAAAPLATPAAAVAAACVHEKPVECRSSPQREQDEDEEMKESSSENQEELPPGKTMIPDRTSEEWRDFVDAHIKRDTREPSCSFCRAENTGGTHQRLGCMPLCVLCLKDVVHVLEARNVA